MPRSLSYAIAALTMLGIRAAQATLFGIALAVAARAPAQVVEAKFELFMTDAPASAHFYETLGFAVVQRKPGGYITLRTGTTVIALSPVPWWLPLRLVSGLRYPPIGTEIVFYTDRLEQMRTTLVAAGYSPGTVTAQPWGDRDFRITDRDGYYVRVSEGHAAP